MALPTMAAWIVGVAAVAGAATAGGVVLYTSGRFANDEGPAAQQAPTETPTAEAASPTAEAADTSTPTPPAEPPTPAAVDPEGWPVIECPAGFEALRLSTRKITACGPQGWTAHQDEMDGSSGRPQGFYAFSFDWQLPRNPAEVIQLSGIEKRSENVTMDGIRPQFCNEWTRTVLLGIPAEQCLITLENQNGPLYPIYGWQLYVFAETADFWLLAEAAGTEKGPESAAVIQRALQSFGSAQANGLGRVR